MAISVASRDGAKPRSAGAAISRSPSPRRTLNYRRSILGFYTNRQAVGVYKCCSIDYGAPTRGYNFDTEFLTPALLPPRTPMFRTLHTLTVRQVLRLTQ